MNSAQNQYTETTSNQSQAKVMSFSKRPALQAASKDETKINHDQIEETLQKIEKRNATFKRVLELAIRSTHTKQWVNLGGKPWPTGPAAESIARDFGISFSIVDKNDIWREDRKDQNGHYYLYMCRGRFEWAGRQMDALGFCSSRDQFFSTKNSYDDFGKKEKIKKTIEEIDETSIAQSAITNCEVNGIMRILGLRNLSWEMLKGFGIDPNEVTKVNYSSTNNSNQPPPKNSTSKLNPTVFCTFGQSRGQKWQDLNIEQLNKYKGFYETAINDRTKARFLKINQDCHQVITNILNFKINRNTAHANTPNNSSNQQQSPAQTKNTSIPQTQMRGQ